jgi:hypothetical protein
MCLRNVGNTAHIFTLLTHRSQINFSRSDWSAVHLGRSIQAATLQETVCTPDNGHSTLTLSLSVTETAFSSMPLRNRDTTWTKLSEILFVEQLHHRHSSLQNISLTALQLAIYNVSFIFIKSHLSQQQIQCYNETSQSITVPSSDYTFPI